MLQLTYIAYFKIVWYLVILIVSLLNKFKVDESTRISEFQISRHVAMAASGVADEKPTTACLGKSDSAHHLFTDLLDRPSTSGLLP